MRTFKVRDVFLCGICRVEHKNETKAQLCLGRCWNILRRRTPFIALKKLGKTCFSCVYCMRPYDDHNAATTCARDCLRKIEASAAREKQELDNPSDDAANKSQQIKRVFYNAKIVMPMPILRPPKKIQVKAIEAEPATPPVAQPAIVAPAQAEAAPKVKKPKDRSKIFERQGAKYVCMICKEKYFTKKEVEACFDQHE